MTTNAGEGTVNGLTSLNDLYELAKKSRKKKLAVAVAHDEHCLEAICAVDKLGLVQAILFGNEQKIKELAQKLNLDVSGMTIINETVDAVAVVLAGPDIHVGIGRGNAGDHICRNVNLGECQ